MMKKIKTLAILTATSLLVACGGGGGEGGGGGTGSVVSTVSFSTAPLKNLRQVASAGTFTISGSCSGTGTENSGAPYATNLYGATYGKTSVTTLNYTNCTGSGASTSNRYFDSNFSTIAVLSSDGGFLEGTVVNALPATVKVGDTITLTSLRAFSSSSKTTQVGTGLQSMVIEADASQSVIINIVTQIYDSSNILSLTGQNRYRLTSGGEVKEISLRFDRPSGQTETWTYN